MLPQWKEGLIKFGGAEVIMMAMAIWENKYDLHARLKKKKKNPASYLAGVAGKCT